MENNKNIEFNEFLDYWINICKTIANPNFIHNELICGIRMSIKKEYNEEILNVGYLQMI